MESPLEKQVITKNSQRLKKREEIENQLTNKIIKNQYQNSFLSDFQIDQLHSLIKEGEKTKDAKGEDETQDQSNITTDNTDTMITASQEEDKNDSTTTTEKASKKDTSEEKTTDTDSVNDGNETQDQSNITTNNTDTMITASQEEDKSSTSSIPGLSTDKGANLFSQLQDIDDGLSAMQKSEVIRAQEKVAKIQKTLEDQGDNADLSTQKLAKYLAKRLENRSTAFDLQDNTQKIMNEIGTTKNKYTEHIADLANQIKDLKSQPNLNDDSKNELEKLENQHAELSALNNQLTAQEVGFTNLHNLRDLVSIKSESNAESVASISKVILASVESIRRSAKVERQQLTPAQNTAVDKIVAANILNIETGTNQTPKEKGNEKKDGLWSKISNWQKNRKAKKGEQGEVKNNATTSSAEGGKASGLQNGEDVTEKSSENDDVNSHKNEAGNEEKGVKDILNKLKLSTCHIPPIDIQEQQESVVTEVLKASDDSAGIMLKNLVNNINAFSNISNNTKISIADKVLGSDDIPVKSALLNQIEHFSEQQQKNIIEKLTKDKSINEEVLNSLIKNYKKIHYIAKERNEINKLAETLAEKIPQNPDKKQFTDFLQTEINQKDNLLAAAILGELNERKNKTSNTPPKKQ